MFESLQESLKAAFRSLRGTTKFTEENMREGLRAVRRSLLEADVHFDVVTRFIERVEKAALGRDVLRSLDPSQQIVEVVYQELVNLMGPVETAIPIASGRPTVLMMCGLQGSGKTTTCGKLAKMLKSQGQHPLLVAADLQRPAAVEQLRIVGEQVGVPVHTETETNPVLVCQNGVKQAKALGANIVILDTAGRLAIDDDLMRELRTIDTKVGPDQCYLVVDALTGQDAVQSAKLFNDSLELDAVILTKLDGDARGGAALSIKEVTGVPIKFIGEGEKLDALSPFRPEGMASRILDMGDILDVVHKTRQIVSEEEALAQQKKLSEGKFDLNDFKELLGKMSGLGSMGRMMKSLPGGSELMRSMGDSEEMDRELRKVSAMLGSMTAEERRNPDILDMSRRRRIAKGSGVEHHEVNKLIKDFERMKPMMKQFASMGMMDRMKGLMNLGNMAKMAGGAGFVNPANMLDAFKPKQATRRQALSGKELAKERKKERQRKKKNRKK